MKKMVPVLIAIVLIIIIAGAAFGMKVVERFSYSKERMDLNEYYQLASAEEVALVLNNDIKEEKGILREGICYLDLNTVHTYLNDRFYADYHEEWLLYTTPDEILYAKAGEAGEDGYVPAFLQDGTMYVALDYVKKYTNFSYSLYTEPNRAVLTTSWEEHQAADIRKDTAVRYQGGVKSDILTEVAAGDKVTVLEEMENWSKVATEDGFWGGKARPWRSHAGVFPADGARHAALAAGGGAPAAGECAQRNVDSCYGLCGAGVYIRPPGL